MDFRILAGMLIRPLLSTEYMFEPLKTDTRFCSMTHWGKMPLLPTLTHQDTEIYPKVKGKTEESGQN
jgi:hypothetical protein